VGERSSRHREIPYHVLMSSALSQRSGSYRP
jgi:hypothetical protein